MYNVCTLVYMQHYILQKKFDDFKSDTQASGELYTAANNLARKFVAEGHSDTVFIQ